MAPSNFANLALRVTGIGWLSEPTTCLRITGKELCFHKIGPIMMPKRIGCKISTMFLFAHAGDKMTKTGIADRMKILLMHLKICIFRTLRVRAIYVTQTSIALVLKCRR